ncbi:polysaccharide biosynthesis C-terminal domain-containing protein [Peribacillus sp. NJ11]|uniref:lipopolysaccharide biosynthesis protein n=1 Tax=Peribacillus sp. NJ11 TaxID=3055861 RepID=UPI0025A09078|nr:polysaccharide biosynthesis C-terminal domain-containing protein [Peribacillus sp. NJ11]MDM5221859.1 polysaccharide biosynthesis C-terminal domain-containing protein [Peribacillus sp. NJ11]
MNVYKKLVNNSLIFAIGNLGTKLIIFLLLPLYTTYLKKSEFGLVDLFTTTLSFLIPIFTLSIFDSVLRFAMDKNYDKQAVLINSIVVTLGGFILSILIYPIFINILPFDDLILYFYLILFFQSINATLTQYVRAQGKIKLFAISGIINAFTLLFCNIVLLVIYQMGIIGYLVSLIFANLITGIFLIYKGKLKQSFKVSKINIKLTKEMLLYSIPLIPNALMWWVMGLSDRYIITYFLGLSATGVYAVANKIPSILNMVNSIFFQAWQMSAIEEHDSKDKDKFFSNVFNIFSIAMLVSASIILVNLKLIMKLVVADNYFEAWKYVPFLLLGVVFSSFSGFLGTNYIAAKKTKGVFKTSVIGAIINIIINVILIPKIGINGAAIGTMVSFAVIWILRIIDTKSFVDISINYKKIILTFIVLFIQIKILYMSLNLEYIIQIFLFLIIALLNLSEIKILIKRILLKLQK